MADDRVQFHVLDAFDPLPVSPSDDQALGYQLLRQTIQSVFPEVNIVAPGNDFTNCGCQSLGAGGGAGIVAYLISTASPPSQLFSLETAGCFLSWWDWKCIFPSKWK